MIPNNVPWRNFYRKSIAHLDFLQFCTLHQADQGDQEDQQYLYRIK